MRRADEVPGALQVCLPELWLAHRVLGGDMSDDRPAIFALDDALKRYGISRDQVSNDNQVKLAIHRPAACVICGATKDELLTHSCTVKHEV
jgi:hypothetical protein